MIQIAICDDNTEFRRNLDIALQKLCPEIFPKDVSYQLGISLGSGKDVLRYIERKWIDVLFLDIDMPEMTGFELAKQLLEKNPEICIVFVSGYDHFVYDVFEFQPFAFLRKERISLDLPKILHRLADKYDTEKKATKVNTVKGEQEIDTREVLYIKSQGNYYILYLRNGRELSCRGTMRDAEGIFSSYGFFRIHSAFLVNLDHIERLERTCVFVGKENDQLPISQRRLKEFRRAYAAFTMESFSI